MQGQRSDSWILHPNNINRDGQIEILEALMHTIKTRNSRRAEQQQITSETARMEICQSQLWKTNKINSRASHFMSGAKELNLIAR